MNCNICPRKCSADRSFEFGYCGVSQNAKIARAALHFWEEPCISGKNGSGTVFFSGCNLGCVFCQNDKISHGCYGKEVTAGRLREIFFELIEKGAHNINLVTPTHYADVLCEALNEPLPVPVVYNCGGYESVETLRRLCGKIDIYLPDFKYADAALAARYSNAPDYPVVAENAIREMFRQVGPCVFDNDGMLKKGMIIRHMILPGAIDNTLDVIDKIDGMFPPGSVLYSIMSQYTPCGNLEKFPELTRKITEEEYEKVLDYLNLCGMENGFVQELSSADEGFIPPFNLEGV